MTVFRRYLLIQVPGWILVAILLWGLHTWDVLSWRAAIVIYSAYVLKDFVLYPFLRRAYDTNQPMPLERMIGESGVAAEDLNPDGYVRIRGELWRAERAQGEAPVRQGDGVRVRSVEGMTLIVTHDPDRPRPYQPTG